MPQSAVAVKSGQNRDEFAQAVLDGFSQKEKSIPCRFLYDAKGSELFEKITETEEYYVTRTEIALLQRHAGEIAGLAGPGAALIEFGSGSSRKTHILIEQMKELAAYVPIDISDAALSEAEVRLNGHYPRLVVLPVHADFNEQVDLPHEVERNPRLGFFPGSTIGNFTHDEARDFLARAARLLGPGSNLVIGVDLKKDPAILLPAYNDAKGVTSDFSLNLLDRINRELDGNLNVSDFAHVAIWNESESRIEIFIESRKDQNVTILDETRSFAKGERIHTEYSHKFTKEGFRTLARDAGWTPQEIWVDANDLFSIHFLTHN